MLHLILPIAYEYNPELIIVSTKFYSNINTICGKYLHNIIYRKKKNINYFNYKNIVFLDIQISPIIYGHLIEWLSNLGNGKLMIYEQNVHDNSTYRKECLLECSKALLGKPISKLCTKKLLNLETKKILHNNIKRHIKNWKSLQL